jgi:hypothetical protein
MKFCRNTLIGLYINLSFVILLWVSIFMGLVNNKLDWKQWLLLFFLVISGIFNVIFAVINIFITFKLYKNNEYNSLRKNMKSTKLGAIPYFIINFIFYFLLFALFFAASRGIMIVTPIPLLFLVPIAFTYLSVLSTSFYGIGFIVILYKAKKLKIGKLIFHILLQLCFVLDVVDTLILLAKNKSEKIYV